MVDQRGGENRWASSMLGKAVAPSRASPEVPADGAGCPDWQCRCRCCTPCTLEALLHASLSWHGLGRGAVSGLPGNGRIRGAGASEKGSSRERRVILTCYC